jgi:gas vesicle protein
MSTGKVLLGILTGFAAGAILGILFAPDKGSVTRMKISQKGEDYADAVKNKFSSFIDSINEKFESVKDDVERGRQKVQDVKKDVKSTATSM